MQDVFEAEETPTTQETPAAKSVPPAAPITMSPNHWRAALSTNPHLYAIVHSVNAWRTGTQLTEAEYVSAVDAMQFVIH